MSRCKKCGFENKDGSKFCGHCGAPLKTRSSLIYIDVDMKGSFYEVDNKVYLTGCWQGKGKNNTEVIALDLQSGKYEPIGNCTNTEI